MTRKDYIMLAKVINNSYRFSKTGDSPESRAAAYVTTTTLMYELMAKLGDDNPRFDADKFEAACREGI